MMLALTLVLQLSSASVGLESEAAPAASVDESEALDPRANSNFLGLGACLGDMCCMSLRIGMESIYGCDLISTEAKYVASAVAAGSGLVGLVAGTAVAFGIASLFTMTTGGAQSGLAELVPILGIFVAGVTGLTFLVGSLAGIVVGFLLDVTCIQPGKALMQDNASKPPPSARSPSTRTNADLPSTTIQY